MQPRFNNTKLYLNEEDITNPNFQAYFEETNEEVYKTLHNKLSTISLTNNSPKRMFSNMAALNTDLDRLMEHQKVKVNNGEVVEQGLIFKQGELVLKRNYINNMQFLSALHRSITEYFVIFIELRKHQIRRKQKLMSMDL